MTTTSTTGATGATATTDVAARRPRARRLGGLVQRQGSLVVLVVLCLVASVRFDSFATIANGRSILVAASFLAVIALGETFVILTGGIDLSVGSLFALGGILAAYGSQHGVVVALVLPLAVCGGIGLLQGLIITRGGLEPFIVTLAGLLLARGLSLLVSDEGRTTYQVPAGSGFRQLAQGSVLGISNLIWIIVVLYAVGTVALRRTSYGPAVLAIGGQQDAAELMGLPVVRTKLVTYTASGLLAGFAGVMIASYISSGVTILGVGTELDAIAAVVLGGTLLTGGAGTVVGTLVGVLLLRVIQNVLNQIPYVNSNWQAVVSGAILLVVVVAQRYLSRARR